MSKKLCICLSLLTFASGAFAQNVTDFEIQVKMGRNGLDRSGTFNVVAANEAGVILGGGTVGFRNGIPSGRSVSLFAGKFDNTVNLAQAKYFQVTMDGKGDTADIRYIMIRCGAQNPRKIVVDESLTPGWNGEKRVFLAAIKDENLEKLTGLVFRMDVKDSQRIEASLDFQVLLTNGKIFQVPIADSIRTTKTGPVDLQLIFPAPIFRSQIKQVHFVGASRGMSGAAPVVEAFNQPDDVLLQEVDILGLRENNELMSIIRPRTVQLQNYESYQSPELTTGAGIACEPFRPRAFNFIVRTGADDLRHDVNAQPNMEFIINMYVKGNRTPIPMVTRALNPFAKFDGGGVWGGYFANYRIAERQVLWTRPEQPPLIQDIERFEIVTVPGWDGSTATNRGLRGTNNARQSDQWDVRGVWIGCAEALPSGRMEQPLSHWTTLFANYKIHRKIGMRQTIPLPVSVTRPFSLKDNIRFTP